MRVLAALLEQSQHRARMPHALVEIGLVRIELRVRFPDGTSRLAR